MKEAKARTPLRTSTRVAATVLAVATVVAAPAAAFATNYYVTTGGSDSNDGSYGHPWRTLQRAANSAGPGTDVKISSGTYAPFSVSRSGAAGAPAIFEAATGDHTVTIQASGGNGVAIGARYVTLSGLNITGATSGQNAGVQIWDGSESIVVAGTRIYGNVFGINANGSINNTFASNNIYWNATGIQINRSGAGDRIFSNKVHDQNRMIVNDSAGGNDYGAIGIEFLHTTGPIRAYSNLIYNNRAASHDYGWDGSGFEIFGASGVTMTRNTMWNNETVLETGQARSDGGCNNNAFTRNIAYGGAPNSSTQVMGLQIRCAANMLVANNSLSDLTYWIYDIELATSSYAANIGGLRILNNATSNGGKLIYYLANTPSNIQIDDNVDSTSYALMKFNGRLLWSFGDVRSGSNTNWNSVAADPQFTDPAHGNFTLRSSSPAVNRGVVLSGVTDGYVPSAPDVGALEYGSPNPSLAQPGDIDGAPAPPDFGSVTLPAATTIPAAPAPVVAAVIAPVPVGAPAVAPRIESAPAATPTTTAKKAKKAKKAKHATKARKAKHATKAKKAKHATKAKKAKHATKAKHGKKKTKRASTAG